MSKYGLIGYPLSHSFSPGYFREKFEKESLLAHEYNLYPIAAIKELPDLLLAQPDLKGLNVTIPYKEQIIPFLDEVAPGAKAVGAVNTIRIESGKLIGFNTDVYGFQKSLENWWRKPATGALILGTGGASKAVKYVLEQLKIPYKFVSRTEKEDFLTYNQVNRAILQKYPLIINTTPLGMYPNLNSAPNLPYSRFSKDNMCYDLVYNPEKTLFLKRGAEYGCLIKNGLEMLILQAERSWQIWNKSELL